MTIEVLVLKLVCMCAVFIMISFQSYVMSLDCSQVKDFKIIMEDRVPEMADLSSTIYQPLSCWSIFSNALPSRKLNASIYLYHCSSDVDPRSCSLFSQCKGNSQDFDSEKYHLLYLTHKFPIQQKVCRHAKINN